MKHRRAFHIVLAFLFFACFFGGLRAQEIPLCGFNQDAQVVQRIKNLPAAQGAGSVAPLKCLKKTLSLAIHIFTDSLNQIGITQQDINDALDTLNNDFKRICLSFKICSQDTSYNYKYFKFDKVLETPEVKSIYEVDNVINVYIVGLIVNPSVAGFASAGDDYMVLSHGCIGSAKCWSHEMGHFFSLLHTFETGNGLEFVNETNCATAGDLICDTYADIDPAPIVGCAWNGTNQDPNGDYYTPIIGNIMSYHPAACKTPFTVGQFNQIINYFITFRNYLK